jgi:hypothetical protein
VERKVLVKVAYVFATDMSATYKLGKMILPQLEQGMHGAQVVGMMFFDDNLLGLTQLGACAPF